MAHEQRDRLPMTKSISRRKILATVASTVLSLTFLPFRSARGSNAFPSTRMLARALSGVLRNRRSARVVGQAYLRSLPGSVDVEFLLDSMWRHEPGPHRSFHRLPTAEVRIILQNKIRNDFAAGRTVVVRGWLLSQTEARLYAIAALL